jgi:N-ethylmaleimide reductase
MGAPPVSSDLKRLIRNTFKNSIILSGGYNLEKAENDLKANKCELVAFGRPFLNNPDLVERFKNGWPLSQELDFNLFYTPGEKGYTSYPAYK